MADIIIKNDGQGVVITRSSYNGQTAISDQGVSICRKSGLIHSGKVGSGRVYLLIDCSSSMANGDKLAQAGKGAADFAKEAQNKGYKVGLIRFASGADCVCEPQTEMSTLLQHLEHLQASGYTDMAKALGLALEMLGDGVGSRVVVLITDGMPDNQGEALAVAKVMMAKGVDIIAIGTDDADRGFLEQIATKTDLAVMVSRERLGQGIAATISKLPMLSEVKQKKLLDPSK